MSVHFNPPPVVTLDIGIGQIELEHDVAAGHESSDLLWSMELDPGDDVTITVQYEDDQIRTGRGRYTGDSKRLPVNDHESLVIPVIESPDLPVGNVVILRWGRS